jgi:hypothetical protein
MRYDQLLNSDYAVERENALLLALMDTGAKGCIVGNVVFVEADDVEPGGA